jgi:aldehyde:ferredoxin oxidoreductase
MSYGYAGKILHIDLTCGRVRQSDLDEQIAEKFIGGYGVGARLLYNLIPPHADPLGPENVLAIMTGPLTGSGVATGTRWTACCKSPLTGTWGDANGSGYFGPTLKAAGYDGLLFYGASQSPVYLYIENEDFELLPADDFWGLDTYETDDRLKERHGNQAEVICIGPAGEKLSLISGIVHAKGRIAARSGVGAVMGSKRLKAVVVKGNKKLPLAQPEEVKRLRAKYTSQIMGGVGSADFYRLTGTAGYIEAGVNEADSPIRNWQGVPDDFKQVHNIGVHAIFGLGRKKRSCWQCPVGCWGEIPLGSNTVHQPEYETSAAFGSNLLMSNLPTLLSCNDICDRYGLDTISAGSTIAFAIECFEAGIITDTDMPDFSIHWGDPKSILTLLTQLAKREGFGAFLADGSHKASQMIGQGSEKFAMHVGGQEVAMHDPRYEPGMGLIYIADATPGRHTQASQFIPAPGLEIEGYPGFGKERENQRGRGRYMKPMSTINHVMNVSGLCLFGYLSTTVSLLPEWLSAVTGKKYDLSTLMDCGERISNIRQAFNVREGVNFLQYKLPGRVYGVPPQNSGPTSNITVDIRILVQEYLSTMDWGQDNPIPSRAKLESLGLADIAGDLWGRE